MVRHHRILMVDDDVAHLSLMSLYLGNTCFPVRTCTRAAQAIAYLRYTAFMLVITDLDMPGMDGAALLYAAKKIRRSQKVMLFTAGERNSAQLLGMGAIGVLRKPFCLDELQRRIRYIVAEERRFSGRLAVRLPVRIGSGEEAELVNISADGLLMENRSQVANGSRLSLGIIGFPNESAAVAGTVVRSYAYEDRFRTAVYFDEYNGMSVGKCFPMFN